MKKKSLFLLTSIMIALTACKGSEATDVTVSDTEVQAASDDNCNSEFQIFSVARYKYLIQTMIF